jgi:hypothetical protein
MRPEKRTKGLFRIPKMFKVMSLIRWKIGLTNMCFKKLIFGHKINLLNIKITVIVTIPKKISRVTDFDILNFGLKDLFDGLSLAFS